MFHKISEHIGISVLFFKISVSCFVVFFAGSLKIIAPGVRCQHKYVVFVPGVRILQGICPFKKIPWGFARGGRRSDLELTDT